MNLHVCSLKNSLFRFIVACFLTIGCVIQVNASCSGLTVVNDWDWLDVRGFSLSKRAVFENYSEMVGQYIQWRETTKFGNPDAFGTMAAKARIVLVDDTGVVQEVIEAKHGRMALHVGADKIKDTAPNPLHETVFLAGEEDDYLKVLKQEEKNLKTFKSSFDGLRSWHTTPLLSKHSIFKDAARSYDVVYKEMTHYENTAKTRGKVSSGLLQRVDPYLRGELFKKKDEEGVDKQLNEIYVYRDIHLYDGEAFAVDNLFLLLDDYKIPDGYDKKAVKAFVLFLTERDPCLSCSVTIQDTLSRKIKEKLSDVVTSVAVSFGNYKERNYKKEETTVIIRDKIKTAPQVVPANNDVDDGADDDVEAEQEPPILHLYRKEDLTGSPIEIARSLQKTFFDILHPDITPAMKLLSAEGRDTGLTTAVSSVDGNLLAFRSIDIKCMHDPLY